MWPYTTLSFSGTGEEVVQSTKTNIVYKIYTCKCNIGLEAVHILRVGIMLKLGCVLHQW
jgi:hypothetical protein